MKIDTLEQHQVSFDEEWNADNDHWILRNDDNRVLLIFTIPARVSEFEYDGSKLENIGYVNNEAFVIIKKCILSKGAVCYIDTEEGELHYHRIVITTDYTDSNNIPSEFLLNIDCVDDKNQHVDITDIKVEKSKKFKQKLRFRKTSVDKNSYIMKLDDTGDYDFKITGTVKGDKLKCYLNCHRS